MWFLMEWHRVSREPLLGRLRVATAIDEIAPNVEFDAMFLGLVYGFLWPQHFARIGAADNRQNHRAPLADLIGAVPGADEN